MRSEEVKRLITVALCITAIAAAQANATVIYVDGAATGANDGSSWVDAYVSLQDALAEASDADKPLEIHVAQGVYTPGGPMGFQPPSGVALRGSYAGVAGIDPNDRDVVDYAAVLGGNRAITVRETASSITIDGFTIVYGNWATISMQNASSTFVDCRFVSNESDSGAIYARYCDSILIGCRFEGRGREAITWMDGNLTLRDCVFADKESTAVTAGPTSIGSPATLDMLRCSFTNNNQAVNCPGTLVAHACTFIGNSGDTNAAVSCSYADSTFVDCRFVNNTTTTIRAGALEISGGNATLTRCVFLGNSNSTSGSGAIWSYESVTELNNCLFAGNAGGVKGPGAIRHYGPILRISNCTFADNRGQPNSISYAPVEAFNEMTQCIVRDGPNPFKRARAVSYSNVEGGYEGQGNVDIDPCFVTPGYWDPNGTPDDPNDDVYVIGDYHLKSQAGHWNSETEGWVLDEVTSPCIDVGDPNGPLGAESFPNGGYVNLGAYGGTAEASRSYFGTPLCEAQIAGDINGDCKVDDLDLDILMSHWLMDATPTVNIPPTVRIISPEDGAELTEPTPIIFRVEASDPDGTIVQVEYTLTWEEGDTSVATWIPLWDSSDGWACEYDWSWVPHYGVWELSAEAIDDSGARVVSATITFTLNRANLE